MYRKTTRWICWLLLLALCATFFAIPAAAAEEDGDDAEASELLAAEETEIPLVNIIEENPAPADEPTADEPAAEEPAPADELPAEDTAADAPPAEEPADEEQLPAEDAAEQPVEDDASEEPSDEMDGGPEDIFVVSYYSGETLIHEEEVAKGGHPAEVPEKDGDEKKISAWMDGDGKQIAPADVTVEENTAFYAWYAPKLKTAEHISYINGMGNAMFSPGGSLTRAQAATILYKLLDSKERGPYACSFSDVSSGAWYAEAVMTLASDGIINGYTNGTFRPNDPVNRAEFVKMLVVLTGVTGSEISFSDVSATYWARDYIAAAAANAWVNGYSDGTFRPKNYITRAEAVVLMNRVLGRTADEDAVKNGEGMLHFIDVPASAWYYAAVMEASVDHGYTVEDGKETWTTYSSGTSGLSAGVHKIGSVYVYIDDNGQPVHMTAGITRVGSKYYYSPTDGYTFTADLSAKDGYVVFVNGTEQELKSGFNTIGSSLFYWDSSVDAPQYLGYGPNKVAGRTYWADADGYIIRNDFGKGVVTLGGKKYLSSGYCDIITSGYAYATDSSTPAIIDLKNKTYEYEGHMYYVQNDYSLLTDGWINRMYFDANGRYTTGDAELDGYVENIVSDFITNNALTRVQKLLKAYYALRGGEGSDFTPSDFKYLPVGSFFNRYRYRENKVYDGLIGSAKQFYTKHYGRCYEWATAYNYLAKRLGFDCYCVVGGIFSNDALHCWNMIRWDGKWHISDVEIEWGWMSGYYGGGLRLYRNLFDQTLSSEWVTFYRNPEVSTVCYTFPD